MQPLIRIASRSIFDCIAIHQAPSSFRQLSTSALRGPNTFTRCRILPSRRHFADDKKPTTPSNSSENPIPLSPPPSSSQPPADEPAKAGNHEASTNSHDLPSAAEHRRSLVFKRFSHLMDNVQGNIFIASQRLNDLTGYSGIEALKARISLLEDALSNAQEAVRTSRQHYKQTIADRAASQREVNNLLSRKETWSPVDVERFTSLYRSDHGNEQAVQEAAAKLADAERAAEQAASKLSASILSRYHEEQIWSDKIRRMSTWGTWGLMGVNVLLFLVFQFGFEPWRRARLVRGFEDKVREALEREKERNHHRDVVGGLTSENKDGPPLDAIVAAGIEELEGEMDGQQKEEPVVDALAVCISEDTDSPDGDTGVPIPENDYGKDLDWTDLQAWKKAVMDLFSERAVNLTQQDVTLIALESAATGAAFVAMMLMLLSNPR